MTQHDLTFNGDFSIRDLRMNPSPHNAVQLLHRTFTDGDRDQFFRELVKNSIQAGAKNIQVLPIRPLFCGPESGIKLAFVDDGAGMTPEEMAEYMGELFNGASAIGLDGNFQYGSRVATLPLNPHGMVICSWTPEYEEGAMMGLVYSVKKGKYGTRQWKNYRDGDIAIEDTTTAPDYLKHPIIREAGHGTVVILLGTSDECHTVGVPGYETILHPEGGSAIVPDWPATRSDRQDVNYFNTKFPEYPTLTERGIRVAEAPQYEGRGGLDVWKEHLAPGEWFDAAVDRSKAREKEGLTGDRFRTTLARGWKDRFANHAEHYALGIPVTTDSGARALVHLALFPKSTAENKPKKTSNEVRMQIDSFGLIYQNETYDLRTRAAARAVHERFGVDVPQVRRRMALFVEPDTDTVVVHPNSSRSRLLINSSDQGTGRFLEEVGEAFAKNMPDFLAEAIAEAELGTGNDKDAEKRQRSLSTKIAQFFRVPRKAKSGPDVDMIDETSPGDTDGPAPTPSDQGNRHAPADGPNESEERPEPKSRSSAFSHAKGQPISHPASLRGRPLDAITPLWLDDDETIEDYFDGDVRFPVHYVDSTRKLYLNALHPILEHHIASATRDRRPDKAHIVQVRARDAIANYLISHIYSVKAVEMTPALLQWRDESVKSVVTASLSDEYLTAMLYSGQTLVNEINNAMKGHAGLGKRDEGEDDAA